MLESPQRDQALRLVEAAVEVLASSLNNVDDSGEINEALEQLKGQHLRACESANLSPGMLAQKLFAAELSDEWCFFGDVREHYAHVLGDSGRIEFERLIRETWSALPALGPNERARGDEAQRGRLQGMMSRLACGDVEALIEVRKKDLSTPSAYEGITQLCVQAQQLERAVTWAEKGLKAFPSRDSKLVHLVRELYAQLGRHDALIQLLFEVFVEKLDLQSFAAMKATCSPGEWDAWGFKAVQHIEAQLSRTLKARYKDRWPKFADGTLLVEMLLVEGDLDGAAVAASKWGCSRAVTDRLSTPSPIEPLSSRER